jgi:hypothetical protein
MSRDCSWKIYIPKWHTAKQSHWITVHTGQNDVAMVTVCTNKTMIKVHLHFPASSPRETWSLRKYIHRCSEHLELLFCLPFPNLCADSSSKILQHLQPKPQNTTPAFNMFREPRLLQRGTFPEWNKMIYKLTRCPCPIAPAMINKSLSKTQLAWWVSIIHPRGRENFFSDLSSQAFIVWATIKCHQ